MLKPARANNCTVASCSEPLGIPSLSVMSKHKSKHKKKPRRRVGEASWCVRVFPSDYVTRESTGS